MLRHRPVYPGHFLTRRVFDPDTTRRELRIIRDDLHCNAVRFQGTDITGPCARELQAFLAEAAGRVRRVFRRPLSYADARRTRPGRAGLLRITAFIQEKQQAAGPGAWHDRGRGRHS